MKKLTIVLIVVLLLTMAFAVPAFASPPTPACNGLDVAHGQIHDSGIPANANALHDLRVANHCGIHRG